MYQLNIDEVMMIDGGGDGTSGNRAPPPGYESPADRNKREDENKGNALTDAVNHAYDVLKDHGWFNFSW